tara:strand:- start:2267 stop:2641 length:375 start_codon:yes stop_codon:yes gene_type:complete
MNELKLGELGGVQRPSVTSIAQKKQTAEVNESLTKPINQQQESEKTQQISKADVENAVTKLNDFVQTVQRNLQFNLDDASGKTIITVVDKQTSEVVRQIPDDVAIKLAQDLQQSEPLSLFNAKV